MYINREDKGNIRQVLDNWKKSPDGVSIIVVTDGSRILGLGDLGAGGMGIPIGKLSLYVAGAGFHPERILPITLDLGTNREVYQNQDVYIGDKRHRLTDEMYYPMIEEFVTAVQDKWPSALIQFEDFSNDHCFEILKTYRKKARCFNDDIQGTGAVIASGFINAVDMSGIPFESHRILFYGAGSAGIGVADVIVTLLKDFGISEDEAKKLFYFVDSKGLVTNNRGDKLASHKVPYARDDFEEQIQDLEDIVKAVKPTVLFGLSGRGGTFTEAILKDMLNYAERPIIFPLSNPTTNSECTAEEAYTATNGKCIFASGSPFDPVELNGETYIPGQGNNMYIFPGLGFGSFIAQAKEVSDEMIKAASYALAEFVTEEDKASGLIYPPLEKIRQISAHIATSVILKAQEQDLASATLPTEYNALYSVVTDKMYTP